MSDERGPSGAEKGGAEDHTSGHRKRLRDRFMLSAHGSFPDYELLELLLFYTIPRRDVKPLAKELLKAFGGNLTGVLNASAQQLREPAGGSAEGLAVLFRAIKECSARMLREEASQGCVLQGWKALVDYCRLTMGASPTEQFRTLYLNTRYRLIQDDLQNVGTLDHTPVYVREIVKRGLGVNAKFVVLCHNHPGGDVTPSNADITVTNRISLGLQTVGLTLLDHIIVSKETHFSFKSAGYI